MTTKIVHCTLCDGSGFVTRIHKTETSCGIARTTCPRCHGTGQKEVSMTNADRIRAMSDEELAKWITYACDADLEMFCSNPKRTRPCDKSCDLCAIDWLKQPAEEEV